MTKTVLSSLLYLHTCTRDETQTAETTCSAVSGPLIMGPFINYVSPKRGGGGGGGGGGEV